MTRSHAPCYCGDVRTPSRTHGQSRCQQIQDPLINCSVQHLLSGTFQEFQVGKRFRGIPTTSPHQPTLMTHDTQTAIHNVSRANCTQGHFTLSTCHHMHNHIAINIQFNYRIKSKNNCLQLSTNVLYNVIVIKGCHAYH